LTNTIKKWLMLCLMVTAAATAHVQRPTIYLADQRAKVNLEDLVPSEFGDWRELKQSSGQIINPQQTELLKKLYSQTLTRSYANSQGIVIMLSIAYGAKQSDGVALHYPEVCYPAQGFQLLSKENATLTTAFGTIQVKQLMTRLGNRSEPVTYWSTLGDSVVRGGTETKLKQLSFGFKGEIPDGLIFRVSSITPDAEPGYKAQSTFVNELLPHLTAESRLRLAGLGGKTSIQQ
jgi:EpsI family protein